jgi:hypothetical protein
LPDIFDEVQEDLRAERARRLGRRFAGVGAAALVLILIGTGGYVYWQQRRSERAEAVASRFIAAAKQADAATSAADAAAATAPLESIAATAPSGYQVLARLRLAGLQWQAGQKTQAIATWKAVSDDSAAPAVLRDLATLASAQHQVDSGNPVLLKQQLESLTGADNRWRPMAEQMIALLDLRMGKPREAAVIIRRLTIDPFVPEGIRQMAADLLTTLPADATAETPTATPPAAQPPAAKAPATPAPTAPKPAAKPPAPTTIPSHG